MCLWDIFLACVKYEPGTVCQALTVTLSLLTHAILGVHTTIFCSLQSWKLSLCSGKQLLLDHRANPIWGLNQSCASKWCHNFFFLSTSEIHYGSSLQQVACKWELIQLYSKGDWKQSLRCLDIMTFSPVLPFPGCGLRAETKDLAPRERFVSSFFLQQYDSAPLGTEKKKRHCLAWFPNAPLLRGVCLVRITAAGPQTEECGAHQILKINVLLESSSISSLLLINQSENKFGQVLGH